MPCRFVLCACLCLLCSGSCQAAPWIQMPQIPESVEKPYLLLLNLIESTNLASTALYVYEAFNRAAIVQDNQLTAKILLVASAVSLAATFWWMVVGHWRTHNDWNGLSILFQCLLNFCFACAFPLAFGLIIVPGVLTEDPWIPLDIQSTVAAVILTVWAVFVLLCLGLRVKVHGRLNDCSSTCCCCCFRWGFESKEEQQSAMMQLPVLGFFLVWKMTPEQVRNVRETTHSYKIVLRIIEDIPETVIAGIDLYVFGGSYFAILDLALSTLEIFIYLTMPFARLIVYIFVVIGRCFYNVAKGIGKCFCNAAKGIGKCCWEIAKIFGWIILCLLFPFYLCFECIKCCVESCIECVDDAATDPRKSRTDSDAATV
eukprot:Skav226144  [mRNA]  locus=scaffold1065:65759:66871:- [translate_table: standard]